MKIRPYRLSEVDLDQFTLAGYSVAGEESIIIAPELDCCFDIGKCPREALTVNHVLLSHGHMDHVAGLPYYFAQRDFQGIEGGTALVPADLVDPLEDLMRAWGRVEGHIPPHQFVGMSAGEDYSIRRDLIVRAFATPHLPQSLGFSIIDVRNKLKSEYEGLSGPEIVALKEQGKEVARRVEMPLVAYLGDTGPDHFADLPHVADARVLLIECTFFDDEHAGRAKAGKHLHVSDLPGILEGMNNERILICHVTRRTHMGLAKKALKDTLDAETLKKVSFLMSREYIEQE
ncbi:MAG: MBL fold metallo-hydrolase [Planctomycetota bacterium]|jgi:ribonuclease Z